MTAILLAIDFGSIISPAIAAAAALGVIALAWAYKRSGTAKIWQETAAGYKERADQLERSLQLADQRISALENEIAVLKAKTDLSVLEKMVSDHHTEMVGVTNALIELLDRHVKEETTVWVALMKVLPSMKETVDEITQPE